MISLDDVRRGAPERIAPWAHRTPVLTSASLDRLLGAQLWFKCENLQRAGAFKFRGAMNAVSRLSAAELERGVATHSSGNHAAALALAAQLRGARSFIVMPRTAREVKKRAVAGYGGEISFCAPTLEARETTLARVLAGDRRWSRSTPTTIPTSSPARAPRRSSCSRTCPTSTR